MSDKPRILFFSWTLPKRGSGANLAMYRHFVQNDDFEVFVISNQELSEDVPLPSYTLPRSERIDRLRSTRAARLVTQYEMLVHARRLPRRVYEIVQEFKPEAIMTIPDHNISWAAWRLARETGLPFVTNFQDWWPRGQFYYDFERPYPPVRALLERRMRRMYQDSALAFCTSDGFKEYLGAHPNAHTLYPISERDNSECPPIQPSDKPSIKILYTGTPFGSYGRLLLEFIGETEKNADIEVVVYGAEPDWPKEVTERLRAAGIYRGFIPFDQLKAKLAEADAFLAIMSFDPALEVMMRTSFTTKVLDYCRRARPVIVWGPDFCQPVKVIDRAGAGITVTSPDPKDVLAAARQLKGDTEAQRRMSEAAWELSQTLFKHDNIHEVFRRELTRICRGDAL
ncbi:MAG: glycosyltransferase [Verrucomicrobiota bacterium]